VPRVTGRGDGGTGRRGDGESAVSEDTNGVEEDRERVFAVWVVLLYGASCCSFGYAGQLVRPGLSDRPVCCILEPVLTDSLTENRDSHSARPGTRMPDKPLPNGAGESAPPNGTYAPRMR
jgi:hypothetical protein